MISKLGAAIILSVATLVLATPTSGFAKSSDPKKSKVLLKQLKKLPKNAPFSQVQKLLKQLTKLDPAKASSYLKTGLSKGFPTNEVDKLTQTVNKIVEKSDLPDSKKESIVKKNEKVADKAPPPEPTPTPYVAGIFASEIVA